MQQISAVHPKIFSAFDLRERRPHHLSPQELRCVVSNLAQRISCQYLALSPQALRTAPTSCRNWLWQRFAVSVSLD